MIDRREGGGNEPRQWGDGREGGESEGLTVESRRSLRGSRKKQCAVEKWRSSRELLEEGKQALLPTSTSTGLKPTVSPPAAPDSPITALLPRPRFPNQPEPSPRSRPLAN